MGKTLWPPKTAPLFVSIAGGRPKRPPRSAPPLFVGRHTPGKKNPSHVPETVGPNPRRRGPNTHKTLFVGGAEFSSFPRAKNTENPLDLETPFGEKRQMTFCTPTYEREPATALDRETHMYVSGGRRELSLGGRTRVRESSLSPKTTPRAKFSGRITYGTPMKDLAKGCSLYPEKKIYMLGHTESSHSPSLGEE